MLLGLTFGEPVYNGNGCPPGSNSFVLTPDKTSLSILTGQFTADTTNGTTWNHCELVIPVLVTSPGVIQADFRGFHSLPDNALHQTFVSHIPIGGPGQTNAQNYLRFGSQTDNFFHSHLFNISFASQTALKLIVSTLLFNPSGTESASASLDSIDLTFGNQTKDLRVSCNSALPLQVSSILAGLIALGSLL